MFTFLRRRAAAATEALLLALLVAMFSGFASITAINVSNHASSSNGITDQSRTIAGADGNAGSADYGLLLAAAIGKSAGPSAPDHERKTVDGVLSFAHGDDFAHGRKLGTDYFVTDAEGKATEVAFAREPSPKLQGTRVRLTGTMQSGTLLADGGSAVVGSASGATTSTGPHRVAVLLFNFSNDATEPYTPDFARGVAFTNSDSVAAYYAESSWGQLTLTGDVFGWYTIPETSTSCDYPQWSSSADQAASLAGVNLAGYDNIVYAFATSTSCGWSGLANMPGKYSWLNGQMAMNLRTMAHELGHNFGTHHASALTCAEGGIPVTLASPSNCTLGEYGDPYSIMGGSSRYHQTNFSHGNFGWLLDANSLTVTSSGDYTLAPAPVQSSNAIALRIPRTSTSWLDLEFRQPYGSEFETFAATSPVATGVTIRITEAYTSSTQSQLVDANPATPSFIDAPLAAGMTLMDPLTGTSITTLAVSPEGALVRIQLGDLVPPPSISPTSSPTSSPSPEPTSSPEPSPSPSTGPTPTPVPTSSVDTEPPSMPTNLRTILSKVGKVSLAWSASTDNLEVTGYLVYRNNVLVATARTTTWNDSTPLKTGSRTYSVVAIDAAGNVSLPATIVAFR
jgi:Gametolysin peptidase M11